MRHRVTRIVLLAAALLPVCGRVAFGGQPPTADEIRLTKLFNTGYYDSVLALIPGLEARARAAGDSVQLGRLGFQRGRVLITIGHQADASRAFDESIALAVAHEDTLGWIANLLFKAYVLRDSGHYDEAMACFERQLDLARRCGDIAGQVTSTQNLAYRDIKRGDLEKAQRGLDEAMRLVKKIDRPDLECSVGLHRGILSRARGNGDEAHRCYRRSWEIARTHDFCLLQIFALNNLGQLEMGLGNWDQAVRYLERSRALANEIGFTRGQALATLNLSEAWGYLGEQKRAMEMIEECMAVCARAGYTDFEEVTTGSLAGKHLDAGRYHASMSYYRRLLDRDFVFETYRRYDSARGVAQALSAIDSLDAAARVLAPYISARGSVPEEMTQGFVDVEYAYILQRLERYREALPVIVSARAAADAGGRTGLGVSARVVESRCRHGLGDVDGAVAVLYAALDSMEVARVEAGSSEWREAFGAHVMADLVDACGVLLEERGSVDGAAREREFYETLQRVKARTLLERVRDPRPGENAATPRALAAVTTRTLQQSVLAPGDVLIDVFAGREHVWVFAVTRDAVSMRQLSHGTSELAERVGVFRDVLASPAASNHRAFNDERLEPMQVALGEEILGGFSELIAGARRVVVAPDGCLASIPFGVLRVDGAMLLDRADVAQVPSAAFLANTTSENVQPASAPRVFVMAGSEDAGLPGAAREADAIADRYGDAHGTRAELNLSTLDDGAAGDVLHIAGHARVNDDSPWQSGFWMDAEPADAASGVRLRGGAPADSAVFSREFATGPTVRAWEIARTRLPYALAVLAGCETAGGRATSGEGVLGLTSAFVSAGVPVVVSSLWPVDDDATARLMTAFYDQLARGQTVATALRLAQAAVRANPATAHPFYWAGFTVVGDGARVIPIAPARGLPWFWVAVAIMSLGAVCSLWYYTRPARRARTA